MFQYEKVKYKVMKMRKETCAHKNLTADVGTIENLGKGFMIFFCLTKVYTSAVTTTNTCNRETQIN